MVKNIIRCVLVFAIAALPPTAGCRNFWKRDLIMASVFMALPA